VSDEILGLDLNEPDEVDWADYAEATEPGKPLPPEGRYFVRLPDADQIKFKAGSLKQLIAEFDPCTMVEGEHEGRPVRFIRCSTKRFKNANASQAGDLFRQIGIVLPASAKNADYVDAFKQCGGAVVEIDLEWNAYDKETKKSVSGMRNFPKRDDGTYQHYLEVPDGLDDQGNPKTRRVWANLRTRPRGFAIRIAHAA
jgi:hypothetical protein